MPLQGAYCGGMSDMTLCKHFLAFTLLVNYFKACFGFYSEIHQFAVDSGQQFVETYQSLEEEGQQILADIQTGRYDIEVDGQTYGAVNRSVSLAIQCPEGMTNHDGMMCSK